MALSKIWTRRSCSPHRPDRRLSMMTGTLPAPTPLPSTLEWPGALLMRAGYHHGSTASINACGRLADRLRQNLNQVNGQSNLVKCSPHQINRAAGSCVTTG